MTVLRIIEQLLKLVTRFLDWKASQDTSVRRIQDAKDEFRDQLKKGDYEKASHNLRNVLDDLDNIKRKLSQKTTKDNR